MELVPLSEALGVEVRGVDLAAPVDDATAAALNRAFVDGVVICLRGQTLDAPAFLRAAAMFGTPFAQIYGQFNLADHPEIGVLTHRDTDSAGTGERKIRGTSWHTDASYFERPPKATMLYAEAVPEEGGDTQFVNLRAAYAALPDDVRGRIDGRTALHVYQSSRSPRQLIKRSGDQVDRFGDGMHHPLVRTHPDTGRKALYLNPIRMESIDGVPREESDRLLDFLHDHVTQPRFEYRHKWRPGDVLMWDNRSALHQANDDYDWRTQSRRLLRIMLEGEAPA
ncbi:MAG: TauD/TfdA family dioxygenase [Alphaproteobacteria bacterium]|nr:TauD/TfdA family dioxygenase [Alphaproteobacteria bacterium]